MKISKRKMSENSLISWELNTKILNNPWIKKSKGELKIFLTECN